MNNRDILQKKCEKYWPDNHACYGEIDVTVVSTNFYDGVQIRHIVLNVLISIYLKASFNHVP